MTAINVVPSVADHVSRIAPRLREADRQEVIAASGRTPEEVLAVGLQGDVCLTWLNAEGDPIAIGGVARTNVEGAGAVWLLATPEIEAQRFAFLRNVGAYLEALHTVYPVLFNYVDARNTLHIRWLRWMGFTFINLHDSWGVEGRPFYEFVRIKHV